jgi:cytochrome oxidase assembly protein ShyY1
MASMKHVPGEGHAHVFLDGRKIMRIYNQWFHLNTYQFSTKAGEQLLSIEFVGNDHAPYTIAGLPVGTEQIVDVPGDEIQPASGSNNLVLTGLIVLLVFAVGGLLFRLKRAK